MLKNILMSVLIIMVPVVSALAEDGDGGAAGAFLQVPIGARPAAMGGAYISISDDGAGQFYNPAGLAMLKKNLFATSYRVMTLDRTLTYASLTIPTRGHSALGVSWLYAGSGSVDARDSDGEKLGHEIAQHNHDFSVVFAKRFETFFAAGLRASYLHSSFAEMVAYTVSFDLGAMFYLSNLYDRDRRELMWVQDMQVGLVIRNLGTSYRWNSENYLFKYTSQAYGTEQKDIIPVEVGLGASARFLERKLILATDVAKNESQSVTFHAGSEYFVTPEFALRAGYSDKRFTAGTGYIFKMTDMALAIDYAFSSDKVDEGSEHIFSFDVLF